MTKQQLAEFDATFSVAMTLTEQKVAMCRAFLEKWGEKR